MQRPAAVPAILSEQQSLFPGFYKDKKKIAKFPLNNTM